MCDEITYAHYELSEPLVEYGTNEHGTIDSSKRNAEAKAEILKRISAAHALSNPEKLGGPVRKYIDFSGITPGDPELIEDYIEKLEDYTAVVARCSESEITHYINEFLSDCKSVVVPHGLDKSWKQACAENGRTVSEDSREKHISNDDLNTIDAVVTSSRCGISLSGVIILDSEPDQGRRAITLIPDTHVVVVYEDTVFGSVPEALDVLSLNPTRPMTWIAGPSATSDIELIRVDGVHGPRNLRVILVKR